MTLILALRFILIIILSLRFGSNEISYRLFSFCYMNIITLPFIRLPDSVYIILIAVVWSRAFSGSDAFIWIQLTIFGFFGFGFIQTRIGYIVSCSLSVTSVWVQWTSIRSFGSYCSWKVKKSYVIKFRSSYNSFIVNIWNKEREYREIWSSRQNRGS